MDTTHLLSDQSMQKFIRDGYVSVKVDLPSSFHEALYDKTEKLFASVGNPSNNLLPRLPEIQKVFTDPAFKGAMVSILARLLSPSSSTLSRKSTGQRRTGHAYG